MAYAFITPYNLIKSRTGGIIARLLARAESLELVGARMYAPSDAMIEEYKGTLDEKEAETPEILKSLKTYLDDNLRPNNRRGIINRGLLLLFEGENAVEILHRVTGTFSWSSRHGDTIRGTYGDYLTVEGGGTYYFEPGLLVGVTRKACRKQLEIFAKYAASDGGVLENIIPFEENEKPRVQTTLVILKPENFNKPSARPGNIIDVFSRTGLYIVGAKILHMSVAQAREFYGPLRREFPERLKFLVEKKIREELAPKLGFNISPAKISQMADVLKEDNAEYEFNKIVEFMTGCHPASIKSRAEENMPGPAKCLALLYRGVDAVAKIREVLGPTDPKKAGGGTVRSDYGADLMKNGAHASDSPENALRERKIIGLAGNEPPDILPIIRHHLTEI